MMRRSTSPTHGMRTETMIEPLSTIEQAGDRSLLSGLDRWLAPLRPGAQLLLFVALTFLIGWLDHVTGWEMSFFVFYALPVLGVAWWVGIRAGLWMSIVAGVVWWVSNQWTSPYETSLGYAWAALSRVFYFFLVVYAIREVRQRQQSDARTIQAMQERRQLELDLVAVSEHEQQRIGQDLHDGLCQRLAAIGCAARVLADELSHAQPEPAKDAVAIEEAIRDAVAEARALARGIFPVHVNSRGLSAALQELANSLTRMTGIEVHLEDRGELCLKQAEVAMHLYRIAQEAVSNAVKHSGADSVQIRLEQDQHMLRMSIEDNGQGMGLSAQRGEGMGLRTMRYRASLLNGELQLLPRLGGGTRVLCQIPNQPEHPNP